MGYLSVNNRHTKHVLVLKNLGPPLLSPFVTDTIPPEALVHLLTIDPRFGHHPGLRELRCMTVDFPVVNLAKL